MSTRSTSRREFLAAVGATSAASILASSAAAPAAEGAEKLAVDGGTPVRKQLLHHQPYGPQFYDDVEKQELIDVLESKAPFRWSAGDSKSLQFEKAYAAHIGVKHAIGVTSGTTALFTAMAAMEIGPGDEVIVPAWTWHSCWHAVVLAGALPVCAEIDESFNLDPARVEGLITPQTKVLMCVHLQGNPADMDRLLAVARKHGLKVLEDVSQAVGASYKGRPLGSMGHIAAASLQVNKTISAGEGGMVYANDAALMERAVRYHDAGGYRPVHQEWLGAARLDPMPGSNFRMTEFTGGVLLAQVRKLDRIVADIRRVARRVYDGIADVPGFRTRLLPDAAGELGAGVYLDLGTNEARERFVAAMRAENLPAGGPSGSVVLPVQPYAEKKLTVHRAWPTFNSARGKAIQYGAASCPRTLDILGRFGGVPLDPGYTESDTGDIVAAIRKVYPQVSGRPARPSA